MKNIALYLLCSIALIGIFSSCISSEETNYMQEIKMPYPLKQYEEYKLAVGDMISCNIASRDKNLVARFNSLITESSGSSTTKTFQINEDGTIVFPFFGSNTALGLTVQKVELAVQKHMQPSITDVQVNITLPSTFFYILSKDKKV